MIRVAACRSTMNDLQLLAINLTRRCNLACAHCYLDAATLQHGAEGELSSAEACTLLDQVAECGDGTMVVLTGGEPLLRRDLEDIIRYGADSGLAMVVGSNGTLLSERRVQSLKSAGLLGLGISVDSLDPQRHDAFRGWPGCWAKTMAGIERCRAHDLSFQLHFSVTTDNADELPGMMEFARSSGARALNVFFLICTGRGESVTDISPQRYEQALAELIAAQSRYPELIIRPRCAPHYKRIAYQRAPSAALNRISGRDGDGCIAGIHYCRVTDQGGVTACPYIPNEVGNIREQGFVDIWCEADDFTALRTPQLQGDCGRCEYRKLCGGCRARPLALGGDLMDADPWCGYQPQGGAVIEPLQIDSALSWSPEAEQRLQRIPVFLRKLVKKRAEAYVVGLGVGQVEAGHLSELAARRFGDRLPKRPST